MAGVHPVRARRAWWRTSRARCIVAVSAGQHGVWAYAAEETLVGAIDVSRSIASDVVTSHFVADVGAVVCLEGGHLVVRASADGSEIAAADLGVDTLPHTLTPVGGRHFVVHTDDGPALLVELDGLRVAGELSFSESIPGNGWRATTTRSAGSLAATSCSNGDLGMTAVVFWRPPAS